MPITSYEIENYWIYHHVADDTNRCGAILCYRPVPDHAAPCAFLQFYRDGTTIPASRENNGRLSLHFQEGQFADLTETLRRDKPLRVYYDSDRRVGYLMTGREPVGDEELP